MVLSFSAIWNGLNVLGARLRLANRHCEFGPDPGVRLRDTPVPQLYSQFVDCDPTQVHPWSIKVLCKSGEHICTKCCKEDSWECSACRALAAAPLPPRPDFPWHIWSVPNERPPPLPRETHVPGRSEVTESASGTVRDYEYPEYQFRTCRFSVPNERAPPLPRETHVPGRTEARAGACGRMF